MKLLAILICMLGLICGQVRAAETINIIGATASDPFLGPPVNKRVCILYVETIVVVTSASDPSNQGYNVQFSCDPDGPEIGNVYWTKVLNSGWSEVVEGVWACAVSHADDDQHNIPTADEFYSVTVDLLKNTDHRASDGPDYVPFDDPPM